jgi:hypothetical protein
MSYYYLVAALPRLVLGERPPLSPEAFIRQVEDLMDPRDLLELKKILDHRAHEGQSDFARSWHAMDTQMRNGIVRIRARRLGIDPLPYLRSHPDFRVYIEQAVTRAMEASSPLETERELDRIRWRWLEESASPDPFGLPAVLSFAARLQIAGRWASIDEVEGSDRLESIIETHDESALRALGPAGGTTGG